jgi:hypothetical protein
MQLKPPENWRRKIAHAMGELLGEQRIEERLAEIQATIDRMNVLVNKFISGLQDSDKYAKFQPGGDSHCDWSVEKSGEFVIDVQVAEK